MANEIDLPKLRKVIDLIFDHISDLGIALIQLPENEDFFWDIPLDSPMDIKNPIKPEPVIGRLSDDWEFLQSILNDKDNAVSLMLIHVAPLLLYVGTKVGK